MSLIWGLLKVIKRIYISGSGGQGVKLMSSILSKIISDLEYNVSLMFDYDAAMRGGIINSFLVYADQKIESPLVEEADLYLKLAENKDDVKAKVIICDKGLCNGKQIPFEQIAKKEFGNVIVINMLALGVLLKELDFDLKKINLDDFVPEKNKDQNIKAIKYGYSLKEL